MSTKQNYNPLMQIALLDADLRECINPSRGLVLVCGQKGSGSRKLMHTLLWNRLLHPKGPCLLIAFESKRKFEVPTGNLPMYPVISRHTVGSGCQFESAALGVSSSLSRGPTDILLGDIPDAEALASAIVAATTGHAVYAPLEACSITSALRSAVSMFPQQNRLAKLQELLAALSLIVLQIKVPGNPYGAQRFLHFDSATRVQLSAARSESDVYKALEILAGEQFPIVPVASIESLTSLH